MADILIKPHNKIILNITSMDFFDINSVYTILTTSPETDNANSLRRYVTNSNFLGRIELTKNNYATQADTGELSQYFVELSKQVKFNKIADFPRDPSERCWITLPIAPVLLASTLEAR